MSLLDNPAIVGLLIAIPSFVLGYLGYRQSVRVDRVTEQSGVASSQVGAIGQVIDGLNKLIANLQEDNKNLRQDVSDLRGKYKELSETCALMGRELDTMKDKYGEKKGGVPST